jgi:small-conductance mechanosensitive channel
MSFNEFMVLLRGILDTNLFRIGETEVTVSTVITMLLIVAVSIWVSKMIRRGIEPVLFSRGGNAATVGTVKTLVHYLILVVGFAAAFQTAGIELTALFAAGAIFAVGLGFAMQNIAESFVAGFILLAERTIKPGDILEVEGRMIRVEEMGVRAIRARTQDGENLIVPNSVLIQSTVKNYTLHDSKLRVRIPVGVVYSSDMRVVRETLEKTADALAAKWGVTDPKPLIVMTEFGDHAVKYEVAIWIADPWLILRLTSDIHEAIWWALKDVGVTIAFHQLDVHFDPPVSKSLQALGGRVA